MAENIRGGLQSVRRGQYEAADALGLTTVQRTAFIVLPQALRVSIPNLVGQAIATFKETSLIAIVGGFDILRIANSTIPNQPDFLGQKRPALFFISVVYFIVAYSMSRASRNLEERLEAGQAR
jgi:general L-amino acid transport system permease protein